MSAILECWKVSWAEVMVAQQMDRDSAIHKKEKVL